MSSEPQESKSPMELEDEIKIKKYKEELYVERGSMRQLAERIASTKPYPRPKKNALQLEQRYYQIPKAKFVDNQYHLRTNYVTAERHSSLVQLNELSKIELSEMMMNKVHLGQYFQCKVSAEAFYSSGLNVLVEDGNGEVEHVVLYNYESPTCSTDPKYILPVGTEIIIKEPHMQSFGQYDSGIRVDSPSDVVIVLQSKNLPTADLLIETGNMAFKKAHYHKASRFYSLAIEVSNQESVRAYLNRAQCFLKMEKYYAAYQDAEKATELDMDSEKAYYRLGKAAYMLRRYEDAKECFEECLNLNMELNDAKVELEKTYERLKERDSGHFNIKGLYEQSFERKELNMDVCDFKSSKIEVADIENKAKGMLAKETIKKGTLIVLSKAATAIFNNKVDYRLKSHDQVQSIARSYTSRHESEAVSELIYKMSDDPETSKLIYSLYAGPNFTRDPVQFPIIDVKRIEAIFAFNSFQIKNSLEMLQLKEMDELLNKTPKYDSEDFTEIDYNSIQFQSNDYQNLSKMQREYDNLDKQCGLWHMVSFFNHSCLSNCNVNFIGDVIVIHANQDISAGEEVTIKYFPPDWTLTQRIDRAEGSYGFRCDCPLCKLDEADPMRKTREEFLDKIEQSENDSLTEALADLKKMKVTYLKRTEYQLQLVTPLEALSQIYRMESQFQKSAECLEQIFTLIKDHNDFVAITIIKEILTDYTMCQNKKKMASWQKTAFEFFKGMNFHRVYFERVWEKIFGFKLN